MMWLGLGAMIVFVLLFTFLPLYRPKTPLFPKSAEVTHYVAQIAEIERQLDLEEGDKSALEAKRTELQRHLLKGAGHDIFDMSPPRTRLVSGLFVGFSLAAFGLYTALGTPEFSKASQPILTSNAAIPATKKPQDSYQASLAELVTELEAKLKQRASDPEGWILYARSLMTLERYDEAFMAYERVLTLTDQNPEVVEELSRARAFVAQGQGRRPAPAISGPGAEEIAAASKMSETERSAMIDAMVEGLSAKLMDAPENSDGWVRLLRSRKVLGQREKAKGEIERMKAVYADRPHISNDILQASGWAVE